tara:strand:+ start:9122 stop:9301 length:180 start_codon:yes stop_codon:yes gene_type:complete
MKKSKPPISELTERELLEIRTTHLADIKKHVKSIDNSVYFIFWCFVLSAIGAIGFFFFS